MITLLILNTVILHAGSPRDTEFELVYEDITYPKNLIPGYILKDFDYPEDIYIYSYRYNLASGNIELNT